MVGLLHPRTCTSRHPRRGRAFTLVELLVVVAVAAMILSMSMPVLGAMTRDVRLTMGFNRSLKLLQDAQRYVKTARVADLDTAEPRIANAFFTGVAAVFYETASGDLQGILAANQQGAEERVGGIGGSTRFIQATLNTASRPAPMSPLPPCPTPYQRLPYDIVAAYEPMSMPVGVRVYGFVADPANPTDTTKMKVVAPPFACCINAAGYGIPPLPAQGRIEVKTDPNATPDPVTGNIARLDATPTTTSLFLISEQQQAEILAATGTVPSPSNPRYGLEQLSADQLQAQIFGPFKRPRAILVGTQNITLLDY